MPVSNTSKIVSFDADAALEAVREVTSGSPRSVVEYDADGFNPLYVDDAALAFYEDEAEMLEHFDRIHSYVHVDFTEKDLFAHELFPIADGVDYIATGLDIFTLVRIYVGTEGLFLAVDRDEPVERIVAAVEDAIQA